MGFEPTPLQTGASSQRLRPLVQTLLSVKLFRIHTAVLLDGQAAIAHTKVLSQPDACFSHGQNGARRGATLSNCSLCSAAQLSGQLVAKPPASPAAYFTIVHEVYLRTRRWISTGPVA